MKKIPHHPFISRFFVVELIWLTSTEYTMRLADWGRLFSTGALHCRNSADCFLREGRLTHSAAASLLPLPVLLQKKPPPRPWVRGSGRQGVAWTGHRNKTRRRRIATHSSFRLRSSGVRRIKRAVNRHQPESRAPCALARLLIAIRPKPSPRCPLRFFAKKKRSSLKCAKNREAGRRKESKTPEPDREKPLCHATGTPRPAALAASLDHPPFGRLAAFWAAPISINRPSFRLSFPHKATNLSR